MDPSSGTQAEVSKAKFQDLKIYSSTEWLAGNKKKYRQVYDQSQLSYIYAELVFINLEFEKISWEANFELKCSKIGKDKKEICSIKVNRQVSKHDHTIFIREGWGQKNSGNFWKKGKYSWDAFMDGKKLSTRYFYIEDLAGTINFPLHHLLKLNSIQFFEGNFDEANEEDKIYYKEFSDEETRYVFTELEFQNRLSDVQWNAEVFIRFFNDARELKGEVIRLCRLKKREESVSITAGWGSNVKGSWRKGLYSVEVIFQDKLIGQSSFNIGSHFIEGAPELIYPDGVTKEQIDEEQFSLTSRKAYKSLNKMVGLRNVKKQIYEHTKYIRFLQLRSSRGFKERDKMSLNCVFTGNPGTGKTTVARLLGAIYHSLGLLKKGHVHEVSRVDLVGEYIGQTAPKVKEALGKAKGGVLFIDEAYSLARNNDDTKDFGKEVIELLVKEMGDPNCDFMVVAAGYPEEMDTFINSNPGLSSRFSYFYEFEDYNLLELYKILNLFCIRSEVELTEQGLTLMQELIQEAFRNRDKSFGNARFVQKLLEKAKINMGIRLMDVKDSKTLSDFDLQLISLEDVLKLRDTGDRDSENLRIDELSLTSAIQELEALHGLLDIKKQVKQLVEMVKFRSQRNELVTGKLNMHTVLVGNPGTGKTTVARIMAKIFKALGILEKGHIIETDRQGLVAGYVGQTAIKTMELIQKAKGGVLFIDEAYALNKQGSHNDFGDEAIQVLIKQMEDKRGDFFVFVAGYPDEMEGFLKTNPGLKSRFDHYLHFKDFSVEELIQIAIKFLSEKKYRISTPGVKLLQTHLEYEFRTRDRMFGNARRVRQIIDEIVKLQNIRLSKENVDPSSNYTTLIKKEDVETGLDQISSEYRYKRPSVGFNR